MRPRFWIVVGAVLACLSVAAGAFGAHAMQGNERFSDTDLDNFETAARYQMYHALALVAVGALAMHCRARSLAMAGWFFLLGTLVFCGMLYAIVFSGVKALGAIVPIGGVAFLVGWGALVVFGLQAKSLRSSSANST